MLMTEPLAATLLSGAILAMLLGDDPRQARRRAGPARATRRATGAGSPGVLLGALAMVRPEYLGVAFLLGAGRPSRAELRVDWRRSLAQAAILVAGVVRRRRPLDDPQRQSPSIASCRSRPAAARSSSPAPTCPPTATRKRSAPRSSPTTRSSSPPPTPDSLRLEQILARLAAARYPGLETDQALSKMGKEQLWRRHHRRAARIRRLRRRPRSAGSGRTGRAA